MMWLCSCYCTKIMQFELTLTLKIIRRVEPSNIIELKRIQNSSSCYIANTLTEYIHALQNTTIRITQHQISNHLIRSIQIAMDEISFCLNVFRSVRCCLHDPLLIIVTSIDTTAQQPPISQSCCCKRALQSL